MAAIGLNLSRVEGGMVLVQEDSGAIRVSVRPPRNVERLLAGRAPQDAVFLTQQISADSAVSHAVAAVAAYEAVGEISVAPNGLLVRDLLHTLSLLHAGLRHFYFQNLPDYVPPAAFAGYRGREPEVKAMAAHMAARERGSWERFTFPHPFTEEEVARLAENRTRAGRMLSRLQRMMATLGGKFPVVMSIVPGGATLPVNEGLIIRLRSYLHATAGFVREGPLQDGLLVMEKQESVRHQGRGGAGMISAGTIGDETGPAASLFPKGVWNDAKLEPLQPRIFEQIRNAFYRVPTGAAGSNGALEFAPRKEGAYTWIKAPRYLDRTMETGPLARLVITHRAGSRSHTVGVVEQIEALLRAPLAEANTVGGRILAGLGELVPLLEYAENLLAQLTPGQPSVTSPEMPETLSGEGTGRIDAPAGMLQHRMVIEKGRIAHADIISPSTWNGSSRGERGETSGLEIALNGPAPDLRTQAGRLTASRIVHSYLFSASDAVQ